MDGRDTKSDNNSDRVDIKRMARGQGRPKTRWSDSRIRHLGPAWTRLARDRRL